MDIALATSAAPTYFPIAEIKEYDNMQFIDGGVWANNPTLAGLIEALTYYVGSDKKFNKLKILSISSLNHTSGKPTGLKRRKSFINWKNSLFETTLVGQSFFTNYFMEKVTEMSDVSIDYVRIPSTPVSSKQEKYIQLDLASKKAIELIRGKGNSTGEIFKKRDEIKDFFREKKKYNIK